MQGVYSPCLHCIVFLILLPTVILESQLLVELFPLPDGRCVVTSVMCLIFAELITFLPCTADVS